MEHDPNTPWWNTDIYGDEEPATTTSKTVAAMNPRIVLIPGGAS